MSSSKVILIGAISVVFGLYNLSLVKVNGSAGRAAEIAVYQAKAADNARSGVQKAVYMYARFGGGNMSQPTTYLDSSGVNQGSCSYSATCSYNAMTNTNQATIVSHGYYRSPYEPASFSPGHDVIRTAYVEITNPGSFSWYNVRLRATYSTVNYQAEHQLDSLQGGKNNLIGY